eukprot:tig00020689_g13004.t1
MDAQSASSSARAAAPPSGGQPPTGGRNERQQPFLEGPEGQSEADGRPRAARSNSRAAGASRAARPAPPKSREPAPAWARRLLHKLGPRSTVLVFNWLSNPAQMLQVDPKTLEPALRAVHQAIMDRYGISMRKTGYKAPPRPTRAWFSGSAPTAAFAPQNALEAAAIIYPEGLTSDEEALMPAGHALGSKNRPSLAVPRRQRRRRWERAPAMTRPATSCSTPTATARARASGPSPRRWPTRQSSAESPSEPRLASPGPHPNRKRNGPVGSTRAAGTRIPRNCSSQEVLDRLPPDEVNYVEGHTIVRGFMDRDKIRCRRADVVFVLGSLRFCRRVFVVPRGAMGVEPDILLGLDAIQAVHGQIDTTLSGCRGSVRPRDATLRSTFPGLSEKAERDLLDAVRAMRGDVTSVVTASLSARPDAPPPTTAAPDAKPAEAPRPVPNAEEEWQELLKKIPELGSHPSITTAQKAELHALLRRYKDVFADKVEAKEGTSNLLYYEHVIKLTTRLPVFTPPRRMNPHAEEHARKEIQKLLELGLIEPSQAAYGSPITERDVFPLPRIDDQLERLRGSMVFSTADATAGFWQLPLHPGSRAYTAFVVPWGHFQWKVTPFGVTNGPAAFSRAITAILGPLLTTCVVAYIDDITVFSPSIDQHLLDLKALFETISKANLRLKPSKCRFCVPEIDLLGHRISAEGIRQDPAKTKVITDWQTPKNADELRSFLGLAGYYRRFVENFSKVVHAMQRLLLKDAVWSWPEDGPADRAFKELKELLGRDIILRFPDFSKPFILQTDASTYAIGAILSQADDKGVERPLAFISRTLLPAEMNYSATELECLAVVWAIKYWRHYLLGGPQFLVRTDHHALQWLKTLDPTTGRLGRWSLLLQAYDFEIVYRPGKQNGPGGADGSSSKPAAYKGAEGFGIPQHAVGAEPEDPDVPLGIFRMQLGPTERALRQLANSAGFRAEAPAEEEESRPPVPASAPEAEPDAGALKRPRPSLRVRLAVLRKPIPTPSPRRQSARRDACPASSPSLLRRLASAGRPRALRASRARVGLAAPETTRAGPGARCRGARGSLGRGDADAPEGDLGAPAALLEDAHAEAEASGEIDDESLPEGPVPSDACDADGFPLALAERVPKRSETGPRRWGAKGFAEPRPLHPDALFPRGPALRRQPRDEYNTRHWRSPVDPSDRPVPIHIEWEPEDPEGEPPPGPPRRRSLSPETARHQIRVRPASDDAAPLEPETVAAEAAAPQRWVELDPRGRDVRPPCKPVFVDTVLDAWACGPSPAVDGALPDALRRMFPPEKRKRLLAAQKEDSFCKKLLAFHAEGENPTVCTRGSRRDADPCSPSCAHCLRAKERFARLAGEFSLADDGVIERNPLVPAGRFLPVLPDAWIDRVLYAYHEGWAHRGAPVIARRIALRFWWPGMYASIARFVRSCPHCQFAKAAKPRRTAIQVIQPSGKGDLWQVDIFHLDMHEDGSRYIIAYVDAYTKFCYIYPLSRISGEALLATAIDFYTHEGVPARILTDRGSQLVGGAWNAFFKEKGTRFVHAAAYHHASNGGAERLGGVYKTLAYAMCREHKRPLSDWPLYNADIVLALRTTVHSATGFSPMVLHRGSEVHLPCEVRFGAGVRFVNPDHTHPADYLLAMTRAAASADAASREYRRFYRNRMVARTGNPPHRRRFEVGDKVLCWMGEHNKGLYNSWVGPYTVTGVNPGGYTYTVKGSAKPYSAKDDARTRPLRETVAHIDCMLPFRTRLSESQARPRVGRPRKTAVNADEPAIDPALADSPAQEQNPPLAPDVDAEGPERAAEGDEVEMDDAILVDDL